MIHKQQTQQSDKTAAIHRPAFPELMSAPEPMARTAAVQPDLPVRKAVRATEGPAPRINQLVMKLLIEDVPVKRTKNTQAADPPDPKG